MTSRSDKARIALVAILLVLPTASLADPVPHGVIVPDRGVDPGMKVIKPKMPRNAVSVVHPRHAAPDGTVPDGTVIVPK